MWRCKYAHFFLIVLGVRYYLSYQIFLIFSGWLENGGWTDVDMNEAAGGGWGDEACGSGG